MKCERCGSDKLISYGQLLREASGNEATERLSYKGTKDKVIANVCRSCAEMLHKLGWKE